jgi:hypothetical protein
MSLEAERLPDREGPGGSSLLAYHFIANSAPPRKYFYLYGKSTDGHSDSIMLGPFKSDNAGKLYHSCNGKNKPLEDFSIVFTGQIPGLATDFVLFSIDTATTSTVIRKRIIGYPLEVHGNDGAHIALVREGRNGSIILCEGKNFKPNEKLQCVSKSGDEIINNSFNCTPDGSFVTLFAPEIIGATGGSAEAEFTRTNGEKFVFHYDWGDKVLKSENQISPLNDEMLAFIDAGHLQEAQETTS